MSRVNQARDAQALNFGVQSSVSTGVKASQATGVLSATAAGPPPTATTNFTASGSANDLAGQVIVTTSTSAVWASANAIYGTILSNTSGASSVVTVDAWWKVADNTAASAPTSTSFFVILPCMMPFWVMGLTTNVSSIAGTETGTAPGGTELLASAGLGRTIATVFSHTASASTGTVGNTFTVTGSPGSTTIGESFLSNSQTPSAASGRGNFIFFADQLNGATGYVVATNGDTLQITYTITYTTVP